MCPPYLEGAHMGAPLQFSVAAAAKGGMRFAFPPYGLRTLIKKGRPRGPALFFYIAVRSESLFSLGRGWSAHGLDGPARRDVFFGFALRRQILPESAG